jgi:hypothetical protein
LLAIRQRSCLHPGERSASTRLESGYRPLANRDCRGIGCARVDFVQPGRLSTARSGACSLWQSDSGWHRLAAGAVSLELSHYFWSHLEAEQRHSTPAAAQAFAR